MPFVKVTSPHAHTASQVDQGIVVYREGEVYEVDRQTLASFERRKWGHEVDLREVIEVAPPAVPPAPVVPAAPPVSPVVSAPLHQSLAPLKPAPLTPAGAEGASATGNAGGATEPAAAAGATQPETAKKAPKRQFKAKTQPTPTEETT